MIYTPTEEYELISTYKGIKYVVWFNDVQGYRCGYVQIPESHPLYEKSYVDYNLNSIYLTFSGHIKNIDGWFIGWDHHHIFDMIDEDGIINAHSNMTSEELNDLLIYAHSMSDCVDGTSYYTNDVEKECMQVIDEILKM